MESAPTGGRAKPRPPAGVGGGAGFGGMGHPALRPPGWLRPSRLVQSTKFVRRGGIYPARGRSRRRGVPGTISGLRAGPYGPVGLRNAPAGAVRASSPTQVCNYTRAAVFRVAVHPAIGCRGGFHIRPWAFAPPQGRADMESAPTGGRAKPRPPAGVGGGAGFGGMGHPALRPPGWLRPSRLVQSTKFVRRGGIYPARGRSRRRKAGPIWNRPLQAAGQSSQPPAGVGGGAGCGGMRDIPPYGRPGDCGQPGWSKTQNLFVGAGFIPPVGVRAAAGFPGRSPA